MAEREHPSPGERRPAIAGSIPPSATTAGADPVEQEWERIERERVAEEIAEAHEDVVEAIVHPAPARGGTWVWLAFLGALLAGVAFALAVNLFYVPARPAPAGGGPAGGPHPPSANEAGPGVGGAEADEPAADDPARSPPPTGA